MSLQPVGGYMDKREMIAQLIQFDLLTGKQHFAEELRSVVSVYGSVTVTSGDDPMFCTITAQFNYTEIPDDVFTAIISRSPFSLATIKSALEIHDRISIEKHVSHTHDYGIAETYFSTIGIVAVLVYGHPERFVYFSVPEIPEGIVPSKIAKKVAAFVELCGLLERNPHIFSNLKDEDPEANPLQETFVFLLSVIEKNTPQATDEINAVITAYMSVVVRDTFKFSYHNEFSEEELPATNEASHRSWLFSPEIPITMTAPQAQLDDYLEHFAYRYGHNTKQITDLRTN